MARPPEDVARELQAADDPRRTGQIREEASALIRSQQARIEELEGALKQIAGGKDDHDQPLSARLLMEFAYAALSERDEPPPMNLGELIDG